MTKTTIATRHHEGAQWFVVDASKETLGRLAAILAQRLQGKHKPTYTAHVDTGDYFVVINAEKVQVTGGKATKKVYRHHTGYPGGLRERTYAHMLEKHPGDIIRLAVKRMLPKSTLGRHMLKKLKVYAGESHDHHAQKPEPIAFGTGR
jgi:large subunit ribosomal protein L13